MAGTGKGVKSRRRKDYAESRTPSIGVDTLAFAHQANLGDSSIQFNTLVQPSSWALSGRVNPSSSTIFAATLFSFKDNLRLSSNLRGHIVPTQYKVFNDHIALLTFTALENEEFFVTVTDVIKTGNPIADVKPVYSPGVLVAATTDFNIGTSVPLESAIVVYRDGVQMFQNTNNSDSVLDGNYYIIPISGAEGSVVRFNTVAGGGGANILVVGTGGMYQRPSFSSLQDIEAIAGQVDQMIPSLALVAGVPESTFQAAPNSVDLKAFGDKILNLEKILEVEITPQLVWQPWTPTFTGFGVPTNVIFEYMVSGTEMFFRGEFINGTTTNTEFRISLPNNWNTKIAQANFIQMGTFTFDSARGGSQFYLAVSNNEPYFKVANHPDGSAFTILNTTGPMPTAGRLLRVEGRITIKELVATTRIKDLI